MRKRLASIVGAVLSSASVFLAMAQASQAVTAVFDSSALTSSTGFDNQTLELAAEFDLGPDWLAAGQPLPGESLSVEISECQFLSDATLGPGSCNQPLNVTDPWTGRVEWTVTNHSGREGPVFLFFSGLQPFADPSDPGVPAADQYDPAEVGLILESADFSVARYRAPSNDYYYLGFLIDDLSQPVDLEFQYEVTRDILGMNTQDLGTPILQMNAQFLPEPTEGILVAFGMMGLLWFGRSRGT